MSSNEFARTEIERTYASTRLCVSSMKPGEPYRASYFVEVLKRDKRTYQLRGPNALKQSGELYIKRLFEGALNSPSLFDKYGVEVRPKILQGEYYYSIADPQAALAAIPEESPESKTPRPDPRVDQIQAKLKDLEMRVQLLESLLE